jgi:hypothetical protein
MRRSCSWGEDGRLYFTIPLVGIGCHDAVPEIPTKARISATGLLLLRHVPEPHVQGHSVARDGFINAATRHWARVAVP